MVQVQIPGKPVAQGRARAYVMGGKARLVDPEKSRDWKSYASGLMQDAMGDRAPLTGPVFLIVAAVWECPKGEAKKRALTERWRPKLPDLDNVIKCCQDAANGVLFVDDKQIVKVEAVKVQAKRGSPPMVVVTVSELEEEYK